MVIIGVGNTKLYAVSPNESTLVVRSAAPTELFLPEAGSSREIVVMNRSVRELDERIEDILNSLDEVLKYKLELVTLPHEGKGPDVGANEVEKVKGDVRYRDEDIILLSHVEEVGTGGPQVLVKVMVNREDKLMDVTRELFRVTVSREEELVGRVGDELGWILVMATDEEIDELVRVIVNMLLEVLDDDKDELGLLEVDAGLDGDDPIGCVDEDASSDLLKLKCREIDKNDDVLGIDPCDRVLKSGTALGELTGRGKEGFGNDNVNQVSERVVDLGDVAEKGRVEDMDSPWETVFIIVVVPVGELDARLFPLDVGDVAGNPGVDRLGVGVGGPGTERSDVLPIDQLDVYRLPVLMAVDSTGCRLGGA